MWLSYSLLLLLLACNRILPVSMSLEEPPQESPDARSALIPRKRRSANLLLNNSSFNAPMPEFNLVDAFSVQLEPSIESSTKIPEKSSVSKEPNEISGIESSVKTSEISSTSLDLDKIPISENSIKISGISSSSLDSEKMISIESSIKASEVSSASMKPNKINPSSQMEINTVEKLASSFLSSRVNMTVVEELEGPLIAPDASHEGKGQRFLKVIVKETWTSLVTQVINSIVYVTQLNTLVVTTVTFRTTSTNTIRVAGTVLPAGIIEC